jgi:hypothetical protein
MASSITTEEKVMESVSFEWGREKQRRKEMVSLNSQ